MPTNKYIQLLNMIKNIKNKKMSGNVTRNREVSQYKFL